MAYSATLTLKLAGCGIPLASHSTLSPSDTVLWLAWHTGSLVFITIHTCAVSVNAKSYGKHLTVSMSCMYYTCWNGYKNFAVMRLWTVMNGYKVKSYDFYFSHGLNDHKLWVLPSMLDTLWRDVPLPCRASPLNWKIRCKSYTKCQHRLLHSEMWITTQWIYLILVIQLCCEHHHQLE